MTADEYAWPSLAAVTPISQHVTGFDPETGMVNYVEVVHMKPLIPAGIPDYIGLEPLVNITITPGLEVTYDGRPAIVCVPPRCDDPLGPGVYDYVLIRYLDGGRERVLVSPYDCAVGIDR